MAALVLEPSHAATKTTEVLSLRGAVRAGRAESVASAVLFRAGLPEGEQGRQPRPSPPPRGDRRHRRQKLSNEEPHRTVSRSQTRPALFKPADSGALQTGADSIPHHRPPQYPIFAKTATILRKQIGLTPPVTIPNGYGPKAEPSVTFGSITCPASAATPLSSTPPAKSSRLPS